MRKKRYRRKSADYKSKAAKTQPAEINQIEPESNGGADKDSFVDYAPVEERVYDCENCSQRKNCSKCSKCKPGCTEICSKLEEEDCNLACASDKELLIRIYCLLLNREHGLKAIEKKLKKSELNDDLKNIKSISDLLERAIVGLGETALGAVKKAVDAAGTMSDITSGLAKIAAGSAQTAGSVAQTANGLATVASGTAGTAGAVALTSAALANTAAAGAATAGAAADIAAETAGIAAAGAVTTGALVDVAAEASGVAAAGAATAGVAGDIAAGAAGTAAAISDTIAGIAGTAAGAAATSAAVSGTVAGTAETVAGAAATSAAISSTVASVATTTAGAAATSAAVSGTDIEAVTSGPVEARSKGNIVQVLLFNNSNVAARHTEVLMYDLTVTPKVGLYMQSSQVPANSSVNFTITSVPALYEVQIKGLAGSLRAYAVAYTEGSGEKPESLTVREAGILCAYP